MKIYIAISKNAYQVLLADFKPVEEELPWQTVDVPKIFEAGDDNLRNYDLSTREFLGFKQLEPRRVKLHRVTVDILYDPAYGVGNMLDHLPWIKDYRLRDHLDVELPHHDQTLGAIK